MEKKYFLHQVKRTNGEYSKGIVICNTFDAAKQGYHAYLGAYAYGHDADTDFVQCAITFTESANPPLMDETWNAPVAPATIANPDPSE